MEEIRHEDFGANSMSSNDSGFKSSGLKKEGAGIGGHCKLRAAVVEEIVDRLSREETPRQVVHAGLATMSIAHLPPETARDSSPWRKGESASDASRDDRTPKPSSCPYTEEGCLERGLPTCTLHRGRTWVLPSGASFTCPPLKDCGTCGGDQAKCDSLLKSFGVKK